MRTPTPTGGVDATRYVRSGDGHIAYQVLSSGATDILLVNESVLPIEALQDNHHTAWVPNSSARHRSQSIASD